MSSTKRAEYELHVANREGIVCILRGSLGECQDRQEDMRNLRDTRDTSIIGPAFYGDTEPMCPRLVSVYGAW